MSDSSVEIDLTRGQSEVLGFIFVFSIVVTTVAIVSAVGYAELEDARDFQRTNSAERGFELLAANVDDLVDARASTRTTRLELADTRITFGDPITMTINGTEITNQSYSVQPLVFDAGDARILYAGGAVIRVQQSGAILVRPPPMVISSAHTVIPVVDVERAGVGGVGGSGGTGVSVRTRRNASASHLSAVADTVSTVNISVTSTPDRAAVWKEYLETQPGTTCTRSGDTVTCEISTDRIHVTVVQVEVTL